MTLRLSSLELLLTAAALTLGTQLAWSEELSFLEAFELAYQSAPEIELARYTVDGSEAQKDIAMGRILPQVSLFGQWSDNRVKYEAAALYPDQDYPGERYGVQVSQPLLNTYDGLEVLRLTSLYEQSQKELLVAEAELIAALAEAYFNVLLADAELEQLRAELVALEQQLEESEALFDRNLLPVTQLLEAQTRADGLRADVIAAEANAAVSRELLSELTGARGRGPMAVREAPVLLNRFKTIEDAARAAVDYSPEISASQKALAAAKRGVDREKSSWLPELQLTYSYQHSDVGFDNLSAPARDTSTLAVGFSYQIFEGGAGAARLRGAWADYYLAKTKLESQQRKTESRARSAWLNLRATGDRLIAAKQAVKTANVHADASRKAVKAGTARLTDVLVALAQQTRASKEISFARLQYAAAWLELELATGAAPSTLAVSLSKALHGADWAGSEP